MQELEKEKEEKESYRISHNYAGILTHGTLRSFLIRINSDAITYFKAKTAEAIWYLSQKDSKAYRLIFFNSMCQIQDT